MRPRICFVLPSLNGGGAERAAVHVLNALDASRWNRSMYLFERRGPYLEDLDPTIVLDAGRRGSRIQRWNALRKYLRAQRPDVALPGWFYEPTVLVGGDPESRIEQEEIFGPVVTVQPFDDEDEAVHLANATSFGLGASIWSREVARARRLASRIEAGMVWTNDVGHSFAAGPAPWGGRKQSGFGLTHSRHALHDMSHLKLVDVDRGRVRVPWWYPYGPNSIDGFEGVLQLLHGDARLRALWTHRRGLAHLAKRYLRG